MFFVDDFSRMTWLSLLKERLEVSNVIELFFNEIKNQFSTSIRVLQADSTLEYVKNDMSIFCSENEIIHHTFRSHTSQWNEIVECKHRHTLDVVRTKMFHMHVLKYLWFDAVLSACHLINRMLFYVFGGKIPFSCIHPHKSVFSMTHRCLAILICLGLISWVRQIVS